MIFIASIWLPNQQKFVGKKKFKSQNENQIELQEISWVKSSLKQTKVVIIFKCNLLVIIQIEFFGFNYKIGLGKLRQNSDK